MGRKEMQTIALKLYQASDGILTSILFYKHKTDETRKIQYKI